MATMIQEDLKEIGIRVQVVPLEFRAMLDRVLQTHDYETAVMGLGRGDTDPNSQINVWLSSGDDHLWNLGSNQACDALGGGDRSPHDAPDVDDGNEGAETSL